MTDFVKEAFARMNLPQIRSFLLCGTDEFSEPAQPYREALKQASDPIYRRLESLYPDGGELDSANADLSVALSAHQDIFMELGMKAGARLLYHLLLTDDTPPECNNKN